MNPVAEIFFNYLHDVIYDQKNAVLNVEQLPPDFQDFGSGLRYFAECVMEAKTLAQALSKGDLTAKIPSASNELASPLKSLHASLKHLTWQTQQVASGDYQQRVKFMGDFAAAFNCMAQQLEERKKIETQERSKLQRYINLILLNTPNMLLVFDAEGKAVLASEAYIKSSGANSADDVQGKTFSELFAPVSSDKFLDDIDVMCKDALLNRHATRIEQRIDFDKAGDLRDYIVHVTPLLHECDKVIGTMVVFHDMTEIMQARREAERARELAEQSTRAKSDFLARMTHEMRTPMNAIIGMTSIGKAAPGIDKKDYSFNKIEEASTHLLGVINDILDISKIEAKKLELSYGVFDLNEMLGHVKSIFGFHVAQKEQKLTFEIDGNIPVNIVSDKQRLAQVITNLLSNAVKFTPKHGSITLTVNKTAEKGNSCTLQFAVKDDGIGISVEQQKYLFTPFEQADGSISRKFGGTGLGLSISKRIIELLGGRIWIESELGKGASFIFEVEVKTGNGAGVSPVSEKAPENGIFKGRRIMIAEDVEINREIISALLSDTGIIIDFACDGIQAVNMFYADPDAYALIFMDIQMPHVDGYEATRRIRSSGLSRAGEIPIIAMTANVFREDIERCIASGMNGHLGKPIDIDEVIMKLKEYI